MADFLPAEHWKEDASGRKHTRPPPHKDASWNFLRGAGPSAAAEVKPFPALLVLTCLHLLALQQRSEVVCRAKR